MKWCAVLFAALLSFAAQPGTTESSAGETGWNEAGVRLGIQVSPKREYFHVYELYAVYGLPWHWRSPSGWGAATQLGMSLGAIHTALDTGFIGSLETGLALSKSGINLVPELGVGLDLMDRRQFGRQDFGSILLFEAYAGLSYRFDCGLGIGYRYLHLSNNRILYSHNTPNPGVDLHMIGVSWHY